MTMNEATAQRQQKRAAGLKIRSHAIELIRWCGDCGSPEAGDRAVWENENFEVVMHARFWIRPKDSACICQMPAKLKGERASMNYAVIVKGRDGATLMHMEWADNGENLFFTMVEFNRGPWEKEFRAIPIVRPSKPCPPTTHSQHLH